MVDTTPLKVPESEKSEDTTKNTTMPEELKLEDKVGNKNEFVPLWMPVLAFALILAAYLYCDVNGIRVNPYYEAGALGISGIFAAACLYLKFK